MSADLPARYFFVSTPKKASQQHFLLTASAAAAALCCCSGLMILNSCACHKSAFLHQPACAHAWWYFRRNHPHFTPSPPLSTAFRCCSSCTFLSLTRPLFLCLLAPSIPSQTSRPSPKLLPFQTQRMLQQCKQRCAREWPCGTCDARVGNKASCTRFDSRVVIQRSSVHSTTASSSKEGFPTFSCDD